MKMLILILWLGLSLSSFAMEKLVISKDGPSSVILKIETTKFTGGKITAIYEAEKGFKKGIPQGDAVTTLEISDLKDGDIIFYQIETIVKPLHKDATLKISLWQGEKELHPEFRHPYYQFYNLTYQTL